MFDASQSRIVGQDHLLLHKIWNAAINASNINITHSLVDSNKVYLAINQELDVNFSKPLNMYEFLPSNRNYYTYSGSLTTYPCTENVRWIVMEQIIKISQRDLSLIRGGVNKNPNTIVDIYGNDNRPIQPLNGRQVLYYNVGNEDVHNHDHEYVVYVSNPKLKPKPKPAFR